MKIFLAVFTSALLSACASAPPYYEIPKPGQRVGIVNLTDAAPVYEHIGTTVFQNSSDRVRAGDDYRSDLGERIRKSLQVRGFEAVILEPTASLLENRTDLFTYASSNINFTELATQELASLASKNSLDYVIAVYPLYGEAYLQSSVYLEGYGLMTRCRFSDCSAYALNYMSARIFDARAGASLKPMPFRFFQQPEMTDIDVSEGVEGITSADIEAAAEKAISDFMLKFNAMLDTSRFIAGN